MKLYGLETVLHFGKHEGKTVKAVMEDKNSVEYISWCFQKLDRFCITDDVFNKLPIIISLRNVSPEYKNESKKWLNRMESIHAEKTEKLNELNQSNYLHDSSYNDDSSEYKFDETFDGDEQMQEWYWSNENN